MLLIFLHQKANLIGIIGVIIILTAYLLLQIDRLSQDSILFSLMNFLGSGFILISLYFTPNLASVIIEIAWFLISLFGLIKATYLKRKHKF